MTTARSACRRWSTPTTDSRWPRSTSTYEVRARCWDRDSAVVATCDWRLYVATRSYCWPLAGWRHSMVEGDGLEGEPEMVDELRLFVDEEEAEYLFRS